VYEDAERIYAGIAKDAKELANEALKVLSPSSVLLPLQDTSIATQIGKGRIMALNTVHVPRREVVSVALNGTPQFNRWLKDEMVQVSRDGSKGYVMVDVAGGSVAPVTGMFAGTIGAQAFKTQSGDFILKNADIELKISDGRIVSLFDTTIQRELIPDGRTAGLVIFEDKPGYWDA
jgi:alpha-mannosidase